METAITRPLSQVKEGQTVSIAAIEGGRELRSRLTAMGLLPKTVINVIRNGKSGPFVINVKNSKVALGRAVAEKIMVS